MINSASTQPEDFPDVSSFLEPIDKAMYCLQLARNLFDRNIPQYFAGEELVDQAIDSLLGVPHKEEI